MERAGPSTTHVDEASCLHDAHNLAEMHYQSTTVARRLSCRPITQQRWGRVKSPGHDIKIAPTLRTSLRRACTLPLNARCITVTDWRADHQRDTFCSMIDDMQRRACTLQSLNTWAQASCRARNCSCRYRIQGAISTQYFISCRRGNSWVSRLSMILEGIPRHRMRSREERQCSGVDAPIIATLVRRVEYACAASPPKRAVGTPIASVELNDRDTILHFPSPSKSAHPCRLASAPHLCTATLPRRGACRRCSTTRSRFATRPAAPCGWHSSSWPGITPSHDDQKRRLFDM